MTQLSDASATALSIPRVLRCQRCAREDGVMWVQVDRDMYRLRSAMGCQECLPHITAQYTEVGCVNCSARISVGQAQMLRTQLDLRAYRIMYMRVHCCTRCRDESEAEVMSTPEFRGIRRTCVVCGTPTTQRCSGCGVDTYCGKNCMRAHWKEHRSRCEAVRDYNDPCKRRSAHEEMVMLIQHGHQLRGDGLRGPPGWMPEPDVRFIPMGP